MPLQPTHAVDTSAVVAYLTDEAGADVFANLISDPHAVLVMHAVNLCELYYGFLRDDGAAVADEAWARTLTLVSMFERCDDPFIKRVARWKGVEGLGLGDAFAAATAEEYACPLVSTDHDDFDPMEAKGVITMLWLRPRL